MRTITAVLAALTLVLAGCGGDDEAASTTSTTEHATTSTTSSPRDAFLDDLDDRLTFVGSGQPDRAADLAEMICAELTDMPAGVAADDAPADSPESDAAIGAALQTMLLDAAREPLDDEVAAIVFELAGEHLCPEHADRIGRYLDDAGLRAAE